MPGTMDLCGRWAMQHSTLVPADGAALTRAGYEAAGWHAADVPTTVLNALVHAGVYPDPRYGLNNYQIPDAADEFNAAHDLAKYSHLPDRRNPWREPWWYRREFDAPAACGPRQRLLFNAWNYRAEVWLNGTRVADRKQMVGGFRRAWLDVTGVLRPGARNVLAVCVWGPDHPGVPTAQLTPFQTPRTHVTGTDNDLMKDVTINVAAVGYDCAPTVRDRLMGLWQEVRLEWGGPVRIMDPWVRTKLPLPALAPAALTVATELVNETAAPVTGVLRAQIEDVVVEQPVGLAAGETRRVEFTPEAFPALRFAQPRLWWPTGYGAQELYELQTTFTVAGAVSDQRRTTFGIREVTRTLHAADGAHGLRVHVNGRRIFCRGGYLQADTLLDWARLGPARWETECQYLVRAHLNTISFEDLPNLPDALFALLDRHGLLLWNCFFQCHWLRTADHPLDHDLLEACAADLVRRCRSHASVVVYMCMNEGATAESQYQRWRRQVTELDGSRLLIPAGYGDFRDWKDPTTHHWPPWILPDTPVGANDMGPKSYGWQDPAWFFRMVREDRSWMFKIESGSASLPPPESLRRFLPELAGDPATLEYPLNRHWANHGANSYYKPVHDAVCRRHGLPRDVYDYWWKASLVSYEQHRAMFEAVNHRMWELTSGFMEWKLNACWPTIQWQLYDYFLRPTPSYYAIRKAGAPVSVLLCPLDNVVTVVNQTDQALRGLRLRVQVYDTAMRRCLQRTVPCRAAADAATEVWTLPDLTHWDRLCFVRLDLADAAGHLLADNFYWLATPPVTNDGRHFDPWCRLAEQDRGCYEPLHWLPRSGLGGFWRWGPSSATGGATIEVTITVPARGRGFPVFVRARVLDRANDEEILPVYWSDNYVTFCPGDCRVLTAELPTAAANQAIVVLVECLNSGQMVLIGA